MNKIRPTELLTQSSILGDFLSDPIKNVPERAPQQKPAKSRVEVKKANKAKEKLRGIRLLDLLYHNKSGIPNRAPGNKSIDGDPMLIPYKEEDLFNGQNK